MNLFFQFLFQCLVCICLFASKVIAQDMVPYELCASTEFEIVGLPLQRPELGFAKILSVQQQQIISWESVSDLQNFNVSMLKGKECYLEVVAPATHPALGHRLEIDEFATLVRTDNKLVIKISTRNSASLSAVLVSGSEIAIREHIDLDSLFGETIKNQVIHGKQTAGSHRFFVPPENGSQIIELTTYFTPKQKLLWMTSEGTIASRELTTIPIGTGLGLKFGTFRGPSLGITGDKRTTPLPLPLQEGWNILSYPYPADMRLGVDWGGTGSGILGSTHPANVDLIQIHQGSKKATYALEITSSGIPSRWRQVHQGRVGEWKMPASYLDVLPVGQGFLLWKTKPQPNHFFHPPKP